ncbi:MAG TPA: hypothetical protein VFC63_18900 [Blastocatellia bacterium]|nr:hypothetical protein [Blastocatellia bacterium]
MRRERVRKLFIALSVCSVLALGAITISAQGQPWHPPAPGQMQFIPMFPVGMQPVGPVPYSWEVGKNRTQHFGDYQVGKRSKEVKRLLKLKKQQEKNNNGPVTSAHP